MLYISKKERNIMKEKTKISRSKLEQDRIDDRKRWILFAIFSALIPFIMIGVSFLCNQQSVSNIQFDKPYKMDLENNKYGIVYFSEDGSIVSELYDENGELITDNLYLNIYKYENKKVISVETGETEFEISRDGKKLISTKNPNIYYYLIEKEK